MLIQKEAGIITRSRLFSNIEDFAKEIMYETDEFDDLEIETIAAAHLFDDDNNCDEERQIDEYSDCGTAAHHYHNSGCGCLTLISVVLSLTLATLLVVFAF